MKRETRRSKSAIARNLAAIGLLAMTAGGAFAQELAYAWSRDAASPVADPVYSFNPPGGAISIVHTGLGLYTVTFAGNSSIDESIRRSACRGTPSVRHTFACAMHPRSKAYFVS